MKNNPNKQKLQPYEFSDEYRIKRNRIQENDHYEFIEFLNWIEKINNGKKKESGKMLVDKWFNKYSDNAIIWLFNRFVNLKRSKPEGVPYESILNEAKSALKTEIYGENIVRSLFGYYGNYLKYLKKKKSNLELQKDLKPSLKKAKQEKQKKKERIAETLKADHKHYKHGYTFYGEDSRDIIDEEGNIILNPNHEHIPNQNEISYVDEPINRDCSTSEEIPSHRDYRVFDENGQLEIPFDY